MEGDYESFEPVVTPSIEHTATVTSSKAIASFALGLLSLLLLPFAGLIALILGLVALILSILGLVDINRNPKKLTGKGLAIAGSALSLVAIIAVLVIFLLAFPSIQKIRKAVEKEACGDTKAVDENQRSTLHTRNRI